MPAGVITLFNPTKSIVTGICQYVSYLNPCFIIDNSIVKNELVLKQLKNRKNVIYIDNHGNKGVAFALNEAVYMCIISKIEWLLLMDQDSTITSKSIHLLFEYALNYRGNDLGIVAANYKPELATVEMEELLEVITSGSLINISICQKIGGFFNDLFIDEVDNEYCLRLNLCHYKILRLNYVFFQHSIGNKQYKNGHITLNYPPVRYYYIFRNTLYVSSKYKEQFPEVYKYKRSCLWKWIKMVFYEEHTTEKLLFMIRGVIDYKKNKLGSYSW